MPYYMRRTKINPNENKRVDFVDQNGDSWTEYPVLHPKFKKWLINYLASNKDNPYELISNLTKDELEKAFLESPWYGSTANDIDWSKRVEMQAILQKYTTNAISSTINLPNTATKEDVNQIYLSAYKNNLKGITVYRDGSRSGVLVSTENKNRNTFSYIDATKRPKKLKGEAHITKINGVSFTVIVGLLDDNPYEIFITGGSIKGEGLIIKQKKGEYNFIQNNESNNTHKVLTDNMPDELAAITRLVSTSLRHGADIKFIVEQLNKCDGDIFSFTKGLARILKKYIPNGAKSTIQCSNCNSKNIVFEEGCNKCLDCGNSKCN